MMRIVDQNEQDVQKGDLDLTSGYLAEVWIKKPGVPEVDFVNKMSYEDDEFEMVLQYVPIDSKRDYERRLEQLKGFLKETDYVVIKIAEGACDPEEYSDVIEKRKEWRKEINDLTQTFSRKGWEK